MSWAIWGSITGRGKSFSLLPKIQTSFEAHTASQCEREAVTRGDTARAWSSTHLHLAPKITNEVSYTSIPHVRCHGKHLYLYLITLLVVVTNYSTAKLNSRYHVHSTTWDKVISDVPLPFMLIPCESFPSELWSSKSNWFLQVCNCECCFNPEQCVYENCEVHIKHGSNQFDVPNSVQ